MTGKGHFGDPCLGGKIVFKLTPKYTTQDWGLNSADPELCHM